MFLTTADAAPQLVQLGQAKTLGMLDHHDRGVRDIDPHLYNRSRDQDMYPAGLEISHIFFFFIAFQPPMHQANPEPGKNLLLQISRFIHGRLEIGEAMSPPLIKAARALANENGVVIIDSPPGTSCPVIASIKGSDFCILVTEPTPFGLNDLELAVDVVFELGIPAGVVINRSDIGDLAVKEFCEGRGIPILMEIPEDRQIAEAYSRGVMIIDVIPEYKEKFQELFAAIRDKCR